MSRPPSPVAERVRAMLHAKEASSQPDAPSPPSREESSPEVFLSVLVEAAYLVAAADGVVSPAERQTLAETIGHVLDGELPQDDLVSMIDAFAEAMGRDGREQRLAAMAGALPDAPARREVLAFAALIALCDRELVGAERRALDHLGASFGFDTEAVRGVLNTVADDMAG